MNQNEEYITATIEGKQTISITCSPPSDYKIVDIFQDEYCKGVSLKLRQLNIDDSNEEWEMQ